MDNYLLLKSMHILGVILFLGNIIVTAVWKMLADRTRSPAIVAHAQWLVTLTDFIFTVIGVAIILVTGRLMAAQFGGLDSALWITWGWRLFLASGLIWVAILIPVQIWQARLAKVFAGQDDIPARYWMLSKVWIGFGIVATVLPLANLYFMVFKPT